MGRRKAPERDVAAEQFSKGLTALELHPLFAPLMVHAYVGRDRRSICPPEGWAVVTPSGHVHAHPTRRAAPEEWMHVIAHCLLHLAFGHTARAMDVDRPPEWNAACDVVVARFLAQLKLGRAPEELRYEPETAPRDEERLYAEFCERGIPESAAHLGTAGPWVPDIAITSEARARRFGVREVRWGAHFAEGLAEAVRSAVNVAAGWEEALGGGGSRRLTPAQRAREWFLSSYPLLGALAASFEIVEDPAVCARLGISVAAVDASSREIFMNRAAGLSEHECRFVMAHELLHVGLRHQARRQGRDPYLWNVACDYVTNAWLVEMGVGDLPQLGALYDPELKGESAESLYDRIVTDIRRFRKLATLRGAGLCDILERGTPDWWEVGDGMALDDFYRRALSQGLVYHEQEGRGYLPLGLVEEIRALSHPPIAWDVALAEWFDEHFPPLERRRSYARPSRRQSATPQLPRPSYQRVDELLARRTFGVVLDSSGSMDRAVLAAALGAIASYSMSREVRAARVVFCDAAAYDAGYMPPEAIAERVRVRGRGGTVLQPGVDLLERAEDFPDDGPILVITDGLCDRIRVRRDHAFLMPEGRSLPFVPRGPVFRIRQPTD